MLHGFASSPRELRPLGMALAAQGFEVLAPLLPGHGERFPGMSSCRQEDWMGALRLTFAALHRDGSPVALLGYCLGGALALAGARELNPRAVLCLSTPIRPLDQTLFPKKGEEYPDLFETTPFITDCQSTLAREWRMASCHHTVTEPFLQSYHDTVEAARRELPEIRCPLALFQGARSSAVGAEHAALIKEVAGNTSTHLVTSKDAGHALAIDHGRRRVAREATNFLLEIERREKTHF
ncbi:MAG: alpha/beta fold hydrolase [Vulcanimicrobiota bacterium]